MSDNVHYNQTKLVPTGWASDYGNLTEWRDAKGKKYYLHHGDLFSERPPTERAPLPLQGFQFDN